MGRLKRLMSVNTCIFSWLSKTFDPSNNDCIQTHDEVRSFLSFQQNAVEMKVHLHYKINIVCPNPASVLSEQNFSTPIEQMYENMWIVSKDEYDKCVVNKSISDHFSRRNLLKCKSPLQLTYYEMVFRAYSPPEGLEFIPGKKYYFIGRKLSAVMF